MQAYLKLANISEARRPSYAITHYLTSRYRQASGAKALILIIDDHTRHFINSRQRLFMRDF